MTYEQIKYLQHGTKGWFEPTGRGWRTCDSLVKRGLMEHNGAARHCGERFRTTPAGVEAASKEADKLTAPLDAEPVKCCVQGCANEAEDDAKMCRSCHEHFEGVQRGIDNPHLSNTTHGDDLMY